MTPIPKHKDENAPELAHYGIVRTMIAQYEFGGYRYTNLADAVAQAKRTQGASE